jgi:pulcherriminic acid synthase
MALAETLRHDAIAQFGARQLSTDVEIGGLKIPSGSVVMALIGAANRDPEVFAEPDKFDIYRPDLDAARAFTAGGRHFGFGGGRHFCMGAQMTRVEATVGLNQLLDVMGNPRFANGTPPRWEGLFFRSEGSMESMFRSPRKLEVEFDPTGARV